MNLELLLTREDGFQLTNATPLQRAICRMETGEPLAELSVLPEVIECIGGAQALAMLPDRAPDTSVLTAAVRTAKSQKAAAKAFRATQLCDLSMLKDGEIARYSILSIEKDKAGAVLEHLHGKIGASKALSDCLLGPPRGESIYVLNQSIDAKTGKVVDRAVEIKVMAGKRAGGALVSRWSVGATFDEAPRMRGGDHVINLPDALEALPARLLPGAQVDLIGSPHAPSGPIYDMYIAYYGRPSADLLYMIAKGPDLNPVRFTPEFCAKLQSSPEKARAYRTDVLAQFADPEDSLLSSLDVEACTRPFGQDHLEPNNQPHVATMDPANRRNAWTLVIARPNQKGQPEIAYARQWVGSKSAPLSSSRIFEQMAPTLELYGCDHVWTDQASFDDKRELAAQKGVTLIEDDFTESKWREMAIMLEKFISERTISLPNNAAMRADILGIQRKLTARSWQVVLPNTGDGRHGDYAPALCLALKHLPSPVFESDMSDMDDTEKRICDFINSSKSNPVRSAAERLRERFAS